MNLIKRFFSRIKSLFKLTSKTRIVIFVTSLVLAITTISLGGFFYTVPNTTKTIEYSGGFEYIVQLSSRSSSVELNEEFTNTVAESIYERIDALGQSGAQVEPEYGQDENGDFSPTIRVSYPFNENSGETWEVQKAEIESLVVEKPRLVMTDIYGNALFNSTGSAKFNADSANPGGAIENPETYEYEAMSKVPIASNGASAKYLDDAWKVSIDLESDAAKDAWFDVTSYVMTFDEGQRIIPIWIGIEDFIDIAVNDWNEEWTSSAGRNPYNFAYVSELPGNILKSHAIDSAKYLISAPTISEALNDTSFVIEGNFNQLTAQNLANSINFGITDYTLSTISSNYVEPIYGEAAFSNAVWAGIIVFALIALFLIFNYGILGLVSTVSIALFLFITMSLFSLLGGNYSPEAIASLIIGIGMAVDANIITFEKFKTELYSGMSNKKAWRKTNKRTLYTIFDANITTLIVAFVLFYFGSRSIIGLSVTLIISIVVTLVVLLVFTRLLSTLIINHEWFKERTKWFGIKKTIDIKADEKINKIDFVKRAKWFGIASAAVISVSLIVFGSFAGVGGTFSKGFNLSQEFSGGAIITVSAPSEDGNDSISISTDEKEEIYKAFKESGIYDSEVSYIYENSDNTHLKEIRITTEREINVDELKPAITAIGHNLNFNHITTSFEVARQLVRDALIAIIIASALIILYILLRFNWSYSIAAVVALAHDALIVTGVFIIFRIEISPVFIAAILSTIGYSLNDTIVTFDRLREKMHNFTGKLNQDEIKKIANAGIRETLKRSLFTSLTTIMAIVVLMSFGNATKFEFNIAMLVGLLAGTYSSIFIATQLWIHLETFRWKRRENRVKKGFWKVSKIEEQTIQGINEFSM